MQRRKTATVNRGTESAFRQGVKVRDDLDAQWGARGRCEPQALCRASPEAPGCRAQRGAGLSVRPSRWLQTKRRDGREIICCGLRVEEG